MEYLPTSQESNTSFWIRHITALQATSPLMSKTLMPFSFSSSLADLIPSSSVVTKSNFSTALQYFNFSSAHFGPGKSIIIYCQDYFRNYPTYQWLLHLEMLSKHLERKEYENLKPQRYILRFQVTLANQSEDVIPQCEPKRYFQKYILCQCFGWRL